MSAVQLKYGHELLSLDLPEARVLRPQAIAPKAAPDELVRAALAEPISSPTLNKIVRPGEQVVIVTSDITRYTGSEHYLPVLVDHLNACGIKDDDITVVIALGIHRAQSETEHRKILGSLYGRVKVVDHDCDNPAELVVLGETTNGIPVSVNRCVAEAERLIVTGTVGFHYFAGFGGGRKGLVPGVASRATCMATHFGVFNPPEIGGKHPRAVTGILEGNPVHEAILEAARMIHPDFLLNTVLSPDKEILEVFCGDLEEAHLAGCARCNALYSVALEEPADLAVVSCGGYPKDINFIQAHKALDYGVQALRPGGTLILLAACADGFGNKTFFDWFRHRDLDEFEAALRRNYEINGQTAHATLAKARKFRVILVSEFSPEQTAAMGMEKAAGLDAALTLAQEGLPSRARTVIIPDGGTVLPRIDPPAG
ncbi:Nickel-dependent lactate racemase [Geoalkalibacter ferrihydriticus]|uniref:Nickel-dependent lactate racemase n=1 Tax=Geoalkalibacter ferrihydriticus TaxID=392333 RepID=A0A1G9LR97_9BACT|nr:nickel-dependent lactate racemase [Geoalkalibacter ferrihydriticus]SDL64480.1 Nickel-dependent lactate racemase [Geoalkalibacter ferrihydriticus]